MRSSSSIGATRASRSWSTRRPATAATPMTAWARSGQGHDPGQEDLAEGRWQASADRVLAGAEQLLDEERVAVGAAMDLLGEIVGRRLVEDRREELARSASGRAARGRSARPGRSARARRATAGADGGGGAHRPGRSSPGATRSVRSWRTRNAIVSRVAGSAQWRSSTMNRTGLDLRQPLEHGRARASSRRAWSDSGLRCRVGGAGRAERRDEAGQILPRRADDLRRRRPSSSVPDERRGAPRRSGRTARRRRRCRRSRRPGPASRAPIAMAAASLDQPRLADAGLAGDELVDRRAGARAASSARAMRRELRLASHEGRADEAAGHGPMIRARPACPHSRRRWMGQCHHRAIRRRRNRDRRGGPSRPSG